MEVRSVSQRPDLGRLSRMRVPHAGGAIVLAGTFAVLAISLQVRTRALDSPFWLDEGLSVGIASHPLQAIPAVLRQDGSPPLYYVLLHFWMGVFGRTEAATHALSLVFALATVPVGLWFGRALFGTRAGWACAVLCAVNPLLSAYAQETRMYSLVALLSLLVSGAFVQTYVFRRRRYRWLLGTALAALLYTHGWGVFLGLATGLAWLVLLVRANDRRGLAVDGAVAFGLAAALFAPWVPTVLFQAAHTAAPWASTPHLSALTRGLRRVAGGPGPLVAVLVAVGAAGADLWRRRRVDEVVAGAVLLGLALATALLAWGFSQHSPAWATRYLTVLLGPLLLFGALVLARAGPAGVAAIVVIAVVWFGQPAYHTLVRKSNIHTVARGVEPLLRRGDYVVAAQPESGPLLRYTLGPGLRYADAMGAVADPAVMDWRDALPRLRASTPRAVLRLADALSSGQRLALVRPVTRANGWRARWTRQVKLKAAALDVALRSDPALRLVAKVAPGRRGTESTLRAVVYERR
jgi:mannosyltransferase